MISANEWWGVMQNYHLKIFPAQILLYLLGWIALAAFLRKQSAGSDRLIKAYFALCFGWIGLILFTAFGQQLPAHVSQSVLFLSLAVLFGVDLAAGVTRFSLPATGGRRTAMLIGLGLVMVAYPLAGLLHGHPESKWLLPGAFPCPTTALALVFIANALPTRFRLLHWTTFGLLLLWAIPFPVLIQIPQFGVFEDGIMVLMGIYAIAMRLYALKKQIT